MLPPHNAGSRSGGSSATIASSELAGLPASGRGVMFLPLMYTCGTPLSLPPTPVARAREELPPAPELREDTCRLRLPAPAAFFEPPIFSRDALLAVDVAFGGAIAAAPLESAPPGLKLHGTALTGSLSRKETFPQKLNLLFYSNKYGECISDI